MTAWSIGGGREEPDHNRTTYRLVYEYGRTGIRVHVWTPDGHAPAEYPTLERAHDARKRFMASAVTHAVRREGDRVHIVRVIEVQETITTREWN